MDNPVYTVGHSTHAIETFIELLRSNEVTAVADVRSSPYSRFNPQFNKEELERALKDKKIAYVYLGRELGARSSDPDCYKEGRVSYRRLAQTELFRTGLERVCKGVQSHRVALMCAEKEPLDCHRTILVSRELVAEGVRVCHILADGELEPHNETLKRLLLTVGLPETDLFRSNEEILDEAYAMQEERIAYADENMQRSAEEAPE